MLFHKMFSGSEGPPTPQTHLKGITSHFFPILASYEEYAHKCWNRFTYQMAIVSNAEWCHWRAIRRYFRVNLTECWDREGDITVGFKLKLIHTAGDA